MKLANYYFGSSNGSENFYSHKPSSIIYTDGIKQLAEECKAYWLINLIISHQCKRKVALEPFQVWELLRSNDCVFDIVATEGNHHIIATQQIPYSDFPYDKAIIWLVDGCMMLPCEY